MGVPAAAKWLPILIPLRSAARVHRLVLLFCDSRNASTFFIAARELSSSLSFSDSESGVFAPSFAFFCSMVVLDL